MKHQSLKYKEEIHKQIKKEDLKKYKDLIDEIRCYKILRKMNINKKKYHYKIGDKNEKEIVMEFI